MSVLSGVLSDKESAALSNTAQSIIRHVPAWLLTVVGLGLVTVQFVQFPIVIWIAVLFASFLATPVGLARFRRHRERNLTAGHRVELVAACLWINLLMGLPAAYLFHHGGDARVVAILVLCGGIISGIVTGRWHPGVMFASQGPYAFYLFFLPIENVSVHGASSSTLTLMGTCMLLPLSYLPLILTVIRNEKKEADHRERLKEARMTAENANEAKSAFVATVSHELRTPISAILAGSEAIEKDPHGARVQNNAALILDAAKMMRVLLNDLLDLAKLEAGKMTIEAISFDLRGLALDVIRFWAKEAARKGVRIRLEGARALPAWVTGDPTRIRQILNNFFSNAIKFTDAGSVTLIFGASAEGLSFTVRDTGPGLTAEQVDRLFQPFAQADSSVARTHGGTGLGLSISLKLATAMGGRISVEGSPGVGAAFTLHAPLPVASPVLKDVEADAVAEPEGLRILVVDDHLINRRAISLMLEPTGTMVVLAEDGEEALSLLATTEFDVVLMDVNMPGLDGWETTRRLRASSGPNSQTPVLAVTGSAENKDLDACFAAGMNGRVIKPIQASELFAALASLGATSGAESEEARLVEAIG